jgi:hypothetical protein
MVLKATVGGVKLEVWFTPSFNIKTSDKALEMMLRTVELEEYDPWKQKMRNVKATRSLNDAYLVLEGYRWRVPTLEITYEQAPEVPSIKEEGVTH